MSGGALVNAAVRVFGKVATTGAFMLEKGSAVLSPGRAVLG